MVDSSTAVAELSLEAKVGQLLDIGIGLGNFESDEWWPTEEMRTLLRELQPGGVRVYGRHAATPHFMAQYANRLQRWAAETTHGLPLLLSCDCEYGPIDITIHETQAYPSLMGRTATGDPALATDVSAAIAREMLSIGLNMNHQPVVDVHTNPDNPVIGVRSPGTDPETASEYARAALEGIHDEGQIAVAKHFPGHGDTELDSHEELPHVRYDRETLEEIHLPPFGAVIEAGVDCIMTSHIVVECIDPERPATLSEPVLTGLLRDELGFDGVVITDAMMMDAIAENYGVGEAAVRAVGAGADLVLTGFVSAAALRETRDALLEAVDDGTLTEERIDRSVERIIALKERYGLADRREADPLRALETVASAEHRRLAATAYGESLGVFGDDAALPFTAETDVLLTGARGVRALEPHLDAAVGSVVSCSLAPTGGRELDDAKPTTAVDASEARLETLRAVAETVDAAVVTTYSREEFPASQRRVVEALAPEVPVVAVSLGLPNEFDRLPANVAYVPTYLQDRLGMPEPAPDVVGEELVSLLSSDPEAEATFSLR